MHIYIYTYMYIYIYVNVQALTSNLPIPALHFWAEIPLPQHALAEVGRWFSSARPGKSGWSNGWTKMRVDPAPLTCGVFGGGP